MRLPADAVLIVVSEGEDDPEAATLLAVWREEALPVFRIGEGSPEAAAGASRMSMSGHGAFASSGLEAALDAIGATTVVVCGGAAAESLTAARDAADLGYRVFRVAGAPDAEAADPSAKVRVVTCETAVAAGRRAKARERWAAERDRGRGAT
jgi:hypothetical protein